MMNTFFSLFLVLVFLLAGCSSPEPQPENKQFDIFFNRPLKAVKAEDIFSNYHYLPLETNDSSLLGNIKRIVYKNDRYFIDNRNRISIFNDEGIFIRTIDKLGIGPYEYRPYWSMNVNEGGNVSLLGLNPPKLTTYTSSGDFLSRIKLDSLSIRDLMYLNDSLLLLRGDHRSEGYKFHILNVESGQIERYFYRMERIAHPSFMKDCMTTYKNKILVCEYKSNEIIEVSKDSASVRYIINVNDKMPPKGYFEKEDADIFDYAQKGYIGNIICYAESDKYILLRFGGVKEKTQAFALINKENRQYIVFDEMVLADGITIKPDFFHSIGEGKLIFEIDPTVILESGNVKFKSNFPDLVEDSNPLLLIIDLD